MSKPYKLSCTLFGHSLDVRSVVTTPDNAIISGSRDKTAKLWRRNGLAGFTEAISYKDQKNFVAAVLYIPPSSEYPDGLIVTGGNDNIILIYQPHEPFSSFTLKEHTNSVCCLANGVDPYTFLSGSWDTTAKFWSLKSLKASSVTYSGHIAAIWSVIELSNGGVATASADKTVGIWLKDGQKIRSINAHTDCVRGLVDFPEFSHFMSVANDASIKVWSYDGEPIDTYYGHSNYIYSIVRNTADDPTAFVTSDEDRTVRYWKNGTNIDIIRLPAQSIWSVACLNNGDIVTASSDGVIRVFTQDESRYANAHDLKAFEEEADALLKQSTQEIGGYKVSDLPGKEALYDPGKTPGQIKMIRESGGVIAYSWVEDGENSHWEKIGDVLGSNDKQNENKTMFEGKAYDFVFSVDVEDGKPPVKLPYNKGEDVYVAANNFITKNNLPAIYLDQVVDFILKNSKGSDPIPTDSNYVDPFTGSSRYTPSSGSSDQQENAGLNMDPFTGGSSYSTVKKEEKNDYFPYESYMTIDKGDPNVILNKLNEFNENIGDGNHKLTNSKIEQILSLCTRPCVDISIIDELFKLLQWPEDKRFPVLDVVRLAVRDKTNNDLIAMKNDGLIMSALKSCINDCSVPSNTVVGFRVLTNLFSHPAGQELIYTHRVDLLELVTSLTCSNKIIEVGLTSFLINLTVLCLKKNDEIGLVLLANVLPDILLNMKDAEAQFRGLVAMGTLLTTGKNEIRNECKMKVNENNSFVKHLRLLASSSNGDLELKRMKCASLVQTQLT